MRIGINLMHLVSNKNGGNEAYGINLTRALAKLGPEVIVFTNEFFKFPSSQNVSTVVIPIISAKPEARIFTEQTQLMKKAYEKRIDLIHSFGNTCPLISKIPNFVTIHDLNFLNISMSRYKKFFYGNLVRMSAKIATKVVTISEFSSSQIQKELGLKNQKLVVAYNGVDDDITYQQNETRSQDFNYIFALSSDSEHKNITNLIKVYKNIKEELKVNLVIAGNVTQSSIEAAKDTDGVTLLGFVTREKLLDLYSNCLCFVMPSFYEGFGIAGVEAMALGCPVLFAENTALPEVGGTAAIYFDPYSLEDMEAAIKDVIYDLTLRNSLKERSLKRATEFTWEASARKIVDSYENVLNGR
jgi:glycosyltransferase involved in cell wall biosynthesis